MKSRTKGVLILIFAAALVVYFVLQTSILTSSSVKTERLFSYTAEDIIETEGFLLREETALLSGKNGIPSYLYKEGQRARNGALIANVFSDKSEITIGAQITALDNKINLLEDSLKLDSSFTTDPIQLEDELQSKVTELSALSGKADISDFYGISSELQTIFNRREFVVGNVNINSKITELKNERQRLINSLSSTYTQIITSKAGYFSSRYDGYENLLSYSKITEKGLDGYREAFALKSGSEKPASYVGKIVSDFVWYFACEVKTADFSKYEIGKDQLKIRFLAAKTGSVDVRIVNFEAKGDKALLILEGTYNCAEFIGMRKTKAEIITASYSGLKVNKDALTVWTDDKDVSRTGVYILSGVQIQLKPVDIIFQKDDYLIITTPPTETKYLLPGEMAVVSGKNLYDGKIVK